MKINFKPDYIFVVAAFAAACLLVWGAFHLNNRFDELERAIIQMKKDVPIAIQEQTDDIKVE